MKMILRWFPHGDDSVTLEQIRQTPGISGVATCLPSVPAGDVWPLETLQSLRKEINAAGLEMEVIESVNVHEDIKTGAPSRDRYIDNYITTIKNLGAVGVKCLCYNFMPVLDFVRTDMAHPLPDGSTVMAYRHNAALALQPSSIAGSIVNDANGFSMPGYEPGRLSAMAAYIEHYQTVERDEYWRNMRYFLDAVIPVAEENGIRMGMHPDDPPWSLFGLPRVITCAENIRTLFSLNDSLSHGLTLCTGSLGENVENDLPAMIREFSGMKRVPFAHVRNIRRLSDVDFDESAHLSSCGDLDMFAIMLALHESGFEGYIRPDHGRMIWGEQARPGYGLYDRALGAEYLLGLWEAIDTLRQPAA
jgi:D-mannonate dehydratase